MLIHPSYETFVSLPIKPSRVGHVVEAWHSIVCASLVSPADSKAKNRQRRGQRTPKIGELSPPARRSIIVFPAVSGKCPAMSGYLIE